MIKCVASICKVDLDIKNEDDLSPDDLAKVLKYPEYEGYPFLEDDSVFLSNYSAIIEYICLQNTSMKKALFCEESITDHCKATCWIERVKSSIVPFNFILIDQLLSILLT